jgi:hypothetical protein
VGAGAVEGGIVTRTDWHTRQRIARRAILAAHGQAGESHHCPECRDVLLAELERGLEQVVAAPRRPTPAGPLVCDCD